MKITVVSMMKMVIIYLSIVIILKIFLKVQWLLIQVVHLERLLERRRNLLRIILLILRLRNLLMNLLNCVLAPARARILYIARVRDLIRPASRALLWSPASWSPVVVARLRAVFGHAVGWPKNITTVLRPCICSLNHFMIFPLPSRLSIQGLYKLLFIATPEGGREAYPSVRTYIVLVTWCGLQIFFHL